jgi:hypothetical protein
LALSEYLAAEVAEMQRITGLTHLGDRTLTPEFVAYERALDRVGKLLADWVRLGFDERMVTLHERQAELVARMVRAVLDDPALGLTDVQRAAAPAVVRGHLRLLAEAA